MKPKPITVKLTQREYEIARFVAVQRNEAGREANADPGKYGNTDMDQFNLHVRGCLGEMAAAKGLNRYWFGAGTGWHDDMDLGVEQVRMTKHLGGRLLIRPEETKLSTIHAPWVLVIQCDVLHYLLAGWIVGRDGVREEFLARPAGRAPAYFVPQEALESFPIAPSGGRAQP
jgi:hypothetical protein